MAAAHEGGQSRIDRLVSPETGSVRRTAAILHIPDLSSLRGEENLPAAPAEISYSLIGRVFRGEERSGPGIERALTHHDRSLTEQVIGLEIYPKDWGGGQSIELSHRTLRTTDRPTDRVPTYRVNPQPFSLEKHFEVIHVPEDGGQATLTVPKSVERLFDGQYISDMDVTEIDLKPGSLVVLPAVPYALSPHDGEFRYLHASSDPHLQFPGHRYPPVFPVEIAGSRAGYNTDLLYVRGHDHRGLIGARISGITGPETVLDRNMYPTQRFLNEIDVVDLRDVVAEVPVFVAPRGPLVGATKS